MSFRKLETPEKVILYSAMAILAILVLAMASHFSDNSEEQKPSIYLNYR